MGKTLSWDDLECIRNLGSGHAGSVVLVQLRKPFRDLPTGAKVAVKVYKSWVMEQPGQYERIYRELDAGRSVNHSNLVETLTLVADPEGKPALVMKYYPGKSLEEMLNELRAEQKTVDLESGLLIVEKLAFALAELHKAGITHRDVKPANIIVTDSGEPILMDLGVVQTAKFPEQTTTNAFLGTIRYAAPEYLFGEEYDDSIDIFSLGAVAWELITGQLYLYEESNWARMIARKSARRSVPFDFSRIQKRFGYNGVEFVKDFFAVTLGHRGDRISSMDLAMAMREKLWKGPFRRNGKILIAGEAPCPRLGEWLSTTTERIPFHEVWRGFMACTNDIDRALLRTLLDLHYWNHLAPVSYLNCPDKRHLESLEDRGLIRTEYHENTWACEVHEAIRLGFRYRML